MRLPHIDASWHSPITVNSCLGSALSRIKWHGGGMELVILGCHPAVIFARRSRLIGPAAGNQQLKGLLSHGQFPALYLITRHGPVPLAVMITVTMSHLWWKGFSKGFRISCASLKSRSHWRSDGNNSNHFICFFEIPYSHHALPSESSQKHSSGLCQTPLLCGQIREPRGPLDWLTVRQGGQYQVYHMRSRLLETYVTRDTGYSTVYQASENQNKWPELTACWMEFLCFSVRWK